MHIPPQLLLNAGAQGLLLSFALVFSGWRKKKPSAFLGTVLAVFALELLNSWAISFGYHNQVGAFPFWTFGSYLLLPPALWLFLGSSFDPSFRFSNRYFWLFVPAVTEVATELSAFYWQRATGHIWEFGRSAAWFVYTEVAPVIAMITVLVFAAIRSRSIVVGALRRKQQAFLIFFGVLAMLWVADAFLKWEVFPLVALLLCASLFALGYVIYFRPGFFDGLPLEKTRIPALQFPNQDDDTAMAELKALFDARKIYRRPRLTVEHLGTELDLPPRYISYLINHVAHSTFSQFVNAYRVAEVIDRLKDPQEQHKNLLGIALDSGFSSKSSFNLIFKNLTGESPSAYLIKHQV